MTNVRGRRHAAGPRTWVVAAMLAVAPLAVVGSAPPASAAARVAVDSELGGTQVRADGVTEVSLSGSGFQSVPGGFGGIYVFFGWVEDPSRGSWRPSNGGRTGVDYLYVPDSEARDNQGFQRFVTFPGSGTSDAANGGELAADGTWSLTMRVPGAVFEAADRDGGTRSVDCREVTCGFLTIGAHGVVSPANETFTPVAMATGVTGSTEQPTSQPSSQPSSGTGGAGAEAEDGSGATAGGAAVEGSAAPDGSDGATTTGPATIGLEQTAIVAGRVLTFTGTGFTPGEQVVAVLGAGETGAGPLTAGLFGEVAGAVTLPPDLRTGTHVLQLAGAGSAQVARADVTVMADPAALTAAEAAAQPAPRWPVIAVFAAAGLLLVLVLSSLVTAGVRRRRRRRTSSASAGAAGPVDGAATSASEQAPDAPPAAEPARGPHETAVLPVRRSARAGGTA